MKTMFRLIKLRTNKYYELRSGEWKEQLQGYVKMANENIYAKPENNL